MRATLLYMLPCLCACSPFGQACREEGLLGPEGLVRVRARGPKAHERERYTLDRCSLQAKFLFALKPAASGGVIDSRQGETWLSRDGGSGTPRGEDHNVSAKDCGRGDPGEGSTQRQLLAVAIVEEQAVTWSGEGEEL